MLPAAFAPFALRNLRTKGAAGPASRSLDQFTATLVRAGRPVATVSSVLDEEEDHGIQDQAPRMLLLEFTNQAEQEYFQSAVARVQGESEVGRFFAEQELDDLDPAEAFIYSLAYATYMEARLSDHCSRFTLFRLPDAADNEWKMIKAPYRQGLAKAIRRLHPGALIANELLTFGRCASAAQGA